MLTAYSKDQTCIAGGDRNRMANLSKAVQEKYVLYDVTSFTQKWHSIPVAAIWTKFTGWEG